MMSVVHSRGEYGVEFGSVRQLGHFSAALIDENVHKLWARELQLSCPTYVIPAGERSKSVSEFGRIQEFLAGVPVSRSGCLAVIGGGVTGDLGGFVAATYMRGVSYLQVPTTLLAMVDSSVGGKVAIDLDAGKNLVGSFYPPSGVLIDTRFLTTLSERDIRNGMAEAWKTAFIMDEQLMALCASPGDYADLVARCVTNKAGIVMEDEFETTGRRAILNFGHTVAHAIETALGYQELLHGEAVAIGMHLEAMIGERVGVTRAGTAAEIKAHLSGAGFDLQHPCAGMDDQLIDLMKRDKKASASSLAFSLLERIGACKLVCDVPESFVREVLR